MHTGASGDNPVYATGNTVNAFGNLSPAAAATGGQHHTFPASLLQCHDNFRSSPVYSEHETEPYAQERKFDNPIYGAGGSTEIDGDLDAVYTSTCSSAAAQCQDDHEQEPIPVPDHEFDNPIYGTGTDDENAY